MSLEEEFHAFAADSREFQGEIRAWLAATGEHLKGVSNKADGIRSELDKHKESQNAHGAAASGKTLGIVAQWLGLFISVLSVGIVVYKLGHGR